MRPVWSRRTAEPKPCVTSATALTAPSTKVLSTHAETKPAALPVRPAPLTTPSTARLSKSESTFASSIEPRMTVALTISSIQYLLATVR